MTRRPDGSALVLAFALAAVSAGSAAAFSASAASPSIARTLVLASDLGDSLLFFADTLALRFDRRDERLDHARAPGRQLLADGRWLEVGVSTPVGRHLLVDGGWLAIADRPPVGRIMTTEIPSHRSLTFRARGVGTIGVALVPVVDSAWVLPRDWRRFRQLLTAHAWTSFVGVDRADRVAHEFHRPKFDAWYEVGCDWRREAPFRMVFVRYGEAPRPPRDPDDALELRGSRAPQPLVPPLPAGYPRALFVAPDSSGANAQVIGELVVDPVTGSVRVVRDARGFSR